MTDRIYAKVDGKRAGLKRVALSGMGSRPTIFLHKRSVG